MLLLLAQLAAASDPAVLPPLSAAGQPTATETSPAGRTYSNVVAIPTQVVTTPWDFFGRERQVANLPGVVMDRRGSIREIRGAAPVLYVDGVRVMTGVRR